MTSYDFWDPLLGPADASGWFLGGHRAPSSVARSVRVAEPSHFLMGARASDSQATLEE